MKMRRLLFRIPRSSLESIFRQPAGIFQILCCMTVQMNLVQIFFDLLPDFSGFQFVLEVEPKFVGTAKEL